MTQIPPGNLENLLNPYNAIAANQHGPALGSISRGSLIAFYYPNSWAKTPNVIHDPYPLIIVTDIWPSYVRGINLHYLTFPYIKSILQGNCGNTGFSYYNIRGDNYIKNAFRMYVRIGMRKVKKLDCDFLLTILGTMRSFAPGEIDNMRRYIQEQLNRQMNPRASKDRTKVMQDALTGGLQRDLIYPQNNVGLNGANLGE